MTLPRPCNLTLSRSSTSCLLQQFSDVIVITPVKRENKISEFFKCDCQDVFFDLLCPELNIEGIVFFYKNSLLKIQDLIVNYFEPMESLLKKTLSIESMWTPIDNVLRKSMQSNWKKIFSQKRQTAPHTYIMKNKFECKYID
jgi:hypothetical protein